MLAIARRNKIVEESVDDYNICKYLYKLADLNGNVIQGDVPMIDDEFAIGFPLNSGDSVSDTGCPDKVDPNGYPHMYVVQYYLKDDQYFVPLSPEQFEDMTDFVSHAGKSFFDLGDGAGYKW